MICSTCGKFTDYALKSVSICDHCVAANQDLYYSLEHLHVIDNRLTCARLEFDALARRGIGDDRLMNPTKGRGRLNAARASVKALESTRDLIRATLIGRGLVEPNLKEQLERSFPNAKQGEVVEWQGKRYRHRWVHEGQDRRGSNSWDRDWDLLP